MKTTMISASLSIVVLAATALGSSIPVKRSTAYSGYGTWLGSNDGTNSSCGYDYEAGSMFVAVDADHKLCGNTVVISCNDANVTATTVDTCMGCDSGHIDMATAVYDACGGSAGGSGDSGRIDFISWAFYI